MQGYSRNYKDVDPRVGSRGNKVQGFWGLIWGKSWIDLSASEGSLKSSHATEKR